MVQYKIWQNHHQTFWHGPAKMFNWRYDAGAEYQSIDQQHENLFVLFRGLGALLEEPHLDINYWFDMFFRSMSDHANLHFGSEEALMEAHRFPGLQRHRQKHIKSLLRLFRLKKRFEAIGSEFDRIEFSKKLLHAMSVWTSRHIAREDQRFANFLRAAAT